MAVAAAESTVVHRLECVSLTTGNCAQLAVFYEHAFGFRRLAAQRHSGPEFERLMGVTGGADSILLGLGDQRLELLQFERRGRPYPHGCASSDVLFQHFAIVVSDMQRAMQRLSQLAGWSAITSGGPQRLPDRSGGVTAFKFRDQEGHPLELLAFPVTAIPPAWRAPPALEPCLGIDHSAICVADTARSIAFYETLGLKVSARSLNTGVEQQRLDGVHQPRLEVTALIPLQPTPHVELLCYQSINTRNTPAAYSNDIEATRLVLEAAAPPGPDNATRVQRRLIDPDGHQLLISSRTIAPDQGTAA